MASRDRRAVGGVPFFPAHEHQIRAVTMEMYSLRAVSGLYLSYHLLTPEAAVSHASLNQLNVSSTAQHVS